jgi:hypothetical protein
MNPVPSSSQALPSTSDLCQSPELAVLAVLQSTLRVTSQVLDIQNPLAGTLDALSPDPDAEAILAQLIIDRCRELSELVSSYRTVLQLPSSWLPEGLRPPVSAF